MSAKAPSRRGWPLMPGEPGYLTPEQVRAEIERVALSVRDALAELPYALDLRPALAGPIAIGRRAFTPPAAREPLDLHSAAARG